MQGTKQFNYKHLLEDRKTEFVQENIVCQIDTVTKYPFLPFVAYVQIYVLFWGDQTDPKSACGGPNSILRTGIHHPGEVQAKLKERED